MAIWIGVFMMIAAGILNGNFAVPLKRASQWSWENSWAVFSVVAFLFIPLALAHLTIPHLFEVYHGLSWTVVLYPLLFGAGWGISQVLLGISIDRVGMALTFAIVIGLSATLGTLIPLMTLHLAALLSPKGILVLVGVVVMSLGIVYCAKAGKEREARAAVAMRGDTVRTSRYSAALLITIAAGVLTPMLNYALAFGGPILTQASKLGATPANATYAVWVVALVGGLPANLLYCFYLLRRNGSWKLFAARSYDWLGAILMGVLWMGSIALYGIATTFLGMLGAAIGWALFSIFVVLAANVVGIATGEWKGVGKRTIRNLSVGLGLLTVACVLIASGNR